MSKESRKLKVVVIGAGSSVFGPPNLFDLINNVPTGELQLTLVDTDEKNLQMSTKTGKKIAKTLDKNVEVEGYKDRKNALPDSDFVLIAAEEDRIERWKLDWQIPREFEIDQTLGENRGPAGLSHTLRTVPLVLDMCKDVEELSPDAFVLVLTNPEDRVAYAINKYTDLDVAGYCDGLWDFKDRYVGELMDVPAVDLYIEAAGINHAVWIKDIKNKRTGKDLYPELVERAREKDWQPLGLHLYETYGFWPHENDEHYGEYISYACNYIKCDGYDFEGHQMRSQKWRKRQTEFIKGNYEKEEFIKDVKEFSWHIYGESPPSDIVKGLFFRTPQYLPNANIPNKRSIPNLPEDMIVEIPATATPGGIKGTKVAKFPDALTTFLQKEGTIQKISAEAAAEGSYDKAKKALILDDSVDSPKQAEKLLERFLEVHQDYLPRF
ncbi:hypothetical protein K9M78_05640 [Candidatus Bipolaricaulota bacterium]|nr:hypothetical protein [Candidatus Bipolaricaulota bacterium]